jgi:hypothetical protein
MTFREQRDRGRRDVAIDERLQDPFTNLGRRGRARPRILITAGTAL